MAEIRKPLPVADAIRSVASVRSSTRQPSCFRVTHWINVLFLTLLLMSWLQILTYHPALEWGISVYT